MITIDTHIIIWNAISPDKLSKKARSAMDIATENDSIIVSDISLWEIAMLMRRGRIQIEAGYREFIHLIQAAGNYHFQRISPAIAEISVNLPTEIHQDPADRIICATAIHTESELVTADKNLRRSNPIKTIW